MPTYTLPAEIIKLSQSGNWDIAKLEWKLKEIYKLEENDEPEHCLCGHSIIEVCIIENQQTNNEAIVGNVCVKKFLGLPSDKIFQAVKKIRKDNEKSLNAESIQYAYEKGWINDWEYQFSTNTIRKRKLSPKQINTRMQINKKMLNNMRRTEYGARP